MKAEYLKPKTIEMSFSSEEIMITASNGGETILDDGGRTGTDNVTEGEVRQFINSIFDEFEEKASK